MKNKKLNLELSLYNNEKNVFFRKMRKKFRNIILSLLDLTLHRGRFFWDEIYMKRVIKNYIIATTGTHLSLRRFKGENLDGNLTSEEDVSPIQFSQFQKHQKRGRISNEHTRSVSHIDGIHLEILEITAPWATLFPATAHY